MRIYKIYIYLIVLSVLHISCYLNHNELKVAPVFSDHMVLQQKSDVTIWGSGNPGYNIEVTSSWGEKSKNKIAEDGSWNVLLKTPKYGGPYEVKIISGEKEIIFEDVMKLIFGTTSYLPYQPRMLLGNINVLSIPYVIYDLAIIGIAAFIWFLFNFIIKYTKIGKLLLSVINDREMSSALGINVNKFFIYTFTFGCLLGCLGGAVSAPMISVVPGIGVEVIVLAFAVVVTGGLGSVTGAAIGALFIGLARTTAIFLCSTIRIIYCFFCYGNHTFI